MLLLPLFLSIFALIVLVRDAMGFELLLLSFFALSLLGLIHPSPSSPLSSSTPLAFPCAAVNFGLFLLFAIFTRFGGSALAERRPTKACSSTQACTASSHLFLLYLVLHVWRFPN